MLSAIDYLRAAIANLEASLNEKSSEAIQIAAYRLCAKSRKVHQMVWECCDYSLDLHECVVEFGRAAQLLRRAITENPDNREYVSHHASIMERLRWFCTVISTGPSPPPLSPAPLNDRYVFLSYVHENRAVAQRVAKKLTAHGINVWIDHQRLLPGDRWRAIIADAIRNGEFFIALFSKEFSSRSRSYMNEELNVAIEELRMRSKDKRWFIPARVSECIVPDWKVGGGETLRDFHFIDLHSNMTGGIRQILRAM